VSTFGIGAGFDVKRWRSVLRQLMVEGYITADPERYGALTLTPESRPLLRGDIELHLREDTSAPTKAKRGGGKRATVDLNPADEALWEELRALRTRLAKDQGLPPYTVFHDATLRDMASARPASLDAMRAISGVGEVKLERYGHEFLSVLRDHGVGATAE